MSDSPWPDDLLTRAEAALRETPVPDGPAPDTLARTRAALPAPGRPRPWLRRVVSAAAAVVLLAGGLVYLGVLTVGAPLAFADVARQLQNAHSLAYQMTIQARDGKEPQTVQVFVKEPRRIRMEGAGGVVSVGQPVRDQYQVLTLNPDTKTAVQVVQKRTAQEQQPGAENPVQLAEELRRLVEREAQPAGRRQLGAVEARGFRVRQGQVDWLIWADPQTRLPLLVEVTFPDGTRSTLSEFRFNPPLDDALFRLEVPPGYTLAPFEVETLTNEEALVRLLRSFAEASGGRFPKRLDDPAAVGKHLRDAHGGKAIDPKNPEVMRQFVNLTRAVMFVISLKSGYGYRPDAARLGDADTIIFWYRPAGATRDRALYGDLHWADVTTDQLPKVLKP